MPVRLDFLPNFIELCLFNSLIRLNKTQGLRTAHAAENQPGCGCALFASLLSQEQTQRDIHSVRWLAFSITPFPSHFLSGISHCVHHLLCKKKKVFFTLASGGFWTYAKISKHAKAMMKTDLHFVCY